MTVDYGNEILITRVAFKVGTPRKTLNVLDYWVYERREFFLKNFHEKYSERVSLEKTRKKKL